jgi:hypothetical protein
MFLIFFRIERSYETDIPTKQFEEKTHAWFSSAHENQGRRGRDQTQKSQGQKAAFGLKPRLPFWSGLTAPADVPSGTV